MKKFLLVTMAIVAFSCLEAFSQNKAVVDYKESSARILEPLHSVLTMPLVADLQVIGNKITYTETKAFENYAVTTEIVSFVPDFKKVALSNAAKAHNADAIIGATVDIITNAQGRLEITICGYPAKYTNFRTATLEDLNVVKKGLEATKMSDSGNAITNPLNPIVAESK
jgi:hypothetical protein